jgi:hypothetical protein
VRILFKSAIRTGMVMTALGLGVTVFAAQAASANTGTITPSIPSGPASTIFNLNLNGATCSGDNSGGYTVISYLVPQGTPTSSFTFNNQSNFPDQGYVLIDNTGTFLPQIAPTTTTAVVPASYAANIEFEKLVTSIGLTVAGPIPTGIIANGTSEVYTAGVACVKAGVVTDSFSQDVTFTATPANNSFSYAFSTGTSVPEAPLAVAIPLVGGAAIVGTIFLRRRRATRRETVSVA